MKCKVCGGELNLQKDFYQCESCGGKFPLASFYEDVEVFLLCRDRDEDGRRTEDSLRAAELFAKLEGAKLKVFFPYHTLESFSGVVFDTLFFDAVEVAKAVLLLGSSKEVFSELFEKNKLLLEEKKIIPLFFGMDAKAIPRNLSAIQGIDMTKIGFEKDLTVGLYNLLGKKEEVVFKEKKNRLPLFLSLGIVVLLLLLAVAFSFLYTKTDFFISDENPLVTMDSGKADDSVVLTETKEIELTDEEKYQKAIVLSEEGNLSEAISIFIELGEYRDSANRLYLLYASYDGYYEKEDGSARLRCFLTGKETISIELFYLNEKGEQLKIIESVSLTGPSITFAFTDSEGNTGSIILSMQDENLSLDVRTDTKNSEFYINDKILSFSCSNKSDKPISERITIENVKEWINKKLTYQEIKRMGIEMEFVETIAHMEFSIPFGVIQKISGTEIKLYFSYYDPDQFAPKMAEMTFPDNQELQLKDAILFSAMGPASVIIPNKIGTQLQGDEIWLENDFYYIPNAMNLAAPHSGCVAMFIYDWNGGYEPGVGYTYTIKTSNDTVIKDTTPIALLGEKTTAAEYCEGLKRRIVSNPQNTDSSSSTSNTESSENLLRVKTEEHNIYSNPSYSSTIVHPLPRGAYTIIAEQTDGEGKVWGKLKSGLGWVCISDVSS